MAALPSSPTANDDDDPWLTSASSSASYSDGSGDSDGSSSSCESQDADNDDWDEKERALDLLAHPELTLTIQIDDQTRREEAGPLPTFSLRCGSGPNTFRWLAMVATQRYAPLCKLHGRPRTREAFHTEPGRFTAIDVKKSMSKTRHGGTCGADAGAGGPFWTARCRVRCETLS